MVTPTMNNTFKYNFFLLLIGNVQNEPKQTSLYSLNRTGYSEGRSKYLINLIEKEAFT